MAVTQEERQRAREAGMILASGLFCETFEALQERYYARWLAAQSTEQREKAWYLQNALMEVRDSILENIQSAVLKEKGRDAELNGILKEAREKKPSPKRKTA